MSEHTLEERIAAATDLAPAERRVAAFFAESGEQVAFLPVAKIAEAIGVSNATVVRTAQRLGYAGLPELKDELQAVAMRRWATPVDRMERSLDELTEDVAALPEHLMAVQAGLLAEAGRLLRPQDFTRAVELLGEAGRILTYGQPPYWVLAEHFTREVRRFGRRSLAVGVRPGYIPEDLLDLGPGDVFLAIAYMRVSGEALMVLDRVRERQVPCVLVTDTLALALKGWHTVALSAPRGELGMLPTATVPLAILEALLLGVGGRDRVRTRAAMATRDELWRRLS